MIYNYNKPIHRSEINVIDAYDDGKKKVVRFDYDENYYEYKYNYGATYGFSFITAYTTESSFTHPLTSGGSKLIYSSSLEADCTAFGKFLEYSLVRMGGFKALSNKSLNKYPE